MLWATWMTAKMETAKARNEVLQVLRVDNKDKWRRKQNKHLSVYRDQEGGDCCRSATQSCPTLRSHGLQHTRPLCPPPSPEVCPSSCPLHPWCHPAISSSDSLFSFCLQSFPTSGTSPKCQLLTSEDQNTGASASVLPVNIQDWLIWSPCSPRDSQESSPAPQFKGINSLTCCLLYSPALTIVCDH